VRVFVLLVAGLALAAAATADAAGPRVIGTMSLQDHGDLQNLPVLAVQWAARSTAVVGGGGAGSGKIAFDPFVVTKSIDATSPALLALTFGGTHLPEVRIDVTIRRGVTATYELSDVLIVGNDRHARDGGGPLLQDLSLSAGAIRETVTSAGGTLTSCFSVKTNRDCDLPL
jgi:type VI protein secretion system component Hcp